VGIVRISPLVRNISIPRDWLILEVRAEDNVDASDFEVMYALSNALEKSYAPARGAMAGTICVLGETTEVCVNGLLIAGRT
jgi:hypothetical protein